MAAGSSPPGLAASAHGHPLTPRWGELNATVPVLQTGKLADLEVPEERTLTFQGLFETRGGALQGLSGHSGVPES